MRLPETAEHPKGWTTSRPLMPLAAFDLELGQRMSKRGAYKSGFFIVKLLGQAVLRALAGLFGLGFVNPLRAYRHIGHDRHALSGHFDEAFANSEVIILALFAHDDFAGDDLSHER